MKNDTKDAVFRETAKRLNALAKGDDASIRARLAELRHGIGKMPGEEPALWGMVFEDLPDYMLGRYGKPSKEEWSIYIALTLYALHQQGNDLSSKNMNSIGISLGKAASRLVYLEGGTDDDRERVSKRFNQIALAVDIDSLYYYLRTFIPLLRDDDIGLDYAMLAQDIYWYQTVSGQASVRLKWGQDYYSVEKDNEEIEK